MTAQQALDQATQRLAAASVPQPRRDAEVLLLRLLGRDRAWLIAHGDEPIAVAQTEDFTAQLLRREAREPLQYITGVQEFYGIPLKVTRDTLIPRPETERLVEAVLEWAKTPVNGGVHRVVDVGTGSGAIAIALATHLPGTQFFATDISAAALAVARENTHVHACDGRIDFLEGDLLEPLPAPLPLHSPFDCIVSNPPYIPLSDATGMQAEVREFEPHTALFAGLDGLDVYRRLVAQAWPALRTGGLLALEIGFGQRDALAALLRDWQNVRFLDDYADIPRVVLAERPA